MSDPSQIWPTDQSKRTPETSGCGAFAAVVVSLAFSWAMILGALVAHGVSAAFAAAAAVILIGAVALVAWAHWTDRGKP